jgi:hypothetical protein
MVLLAFHPVHAQWNPLTSGLQSIRSLTSMGTDLYAATYPSGVKKSTNGGTVWNPVNTGLPMSGFEHLLRIGREQRYLSLRRDQVRHLPVHHAG